MDDNHQKNAALAALAEANRLPSEEIWSAEAGKSGKVNILFIETSKIEQAKQMMQIGLAGGEGRYLTCEQVDGVWSIVGGGRWIG